MMSKPFVALRARRLPIALLLALAGTAAHAFTAVPAFAPKPLLVFSGPAQAGGQYPGAAPYAPPIYIAAENRYVGMTQRGGEKWLGAWGSEFEGGVLFQVGADGSGYAYQTLGGRIGVQITPLLYDAKSGDIYGGAESAVDENGANPGGMLFVIRGGQIRPLVNQGAELPVADFQPRGQMALDGQGRLLMNGAGGLAVCGPDHASRNTRNVLYHFWPLTGQWLQPSANMCDFVETITRMGGTPTRPRPISTTIHHKGSAPQLLVWSETDQALYALAGNAGSEENIPGVPEVDNKGKPVATLLRIRGTDLQTRIAPNEGDKIEVLHLFAKARDGELRTGMDYTSGLIEVGEWLYGTAYVSTTANSTAVPGGTIWRIHKQRGTDSFEVLHRFADNDNGVENDGSNPAGALVRAADGNLYGTTVSDKRVMTPTGSDAIGAGTLYRIVSPESSQPKYEPLSYFDVTTTGARPAGLNAGPMLANSQGQRVQRLIGVARFGGNAEDAIQSRDTAGGYGTLFTVDVPVVDATLTRFVSGVSVTRPGTRPTLQWTSTGTERCQASGDWDGEREPSGSYRLPALSTLGDYVYTLQCSGYSGQTEIKQVSIKVIDGSGTEDSGKGGGGSVPGGLLLLGLAAAVRRRWRAAARDLTA